MDVLNSEMNELLNLKTCSPFMIYIVMVFLCLFKIYYTRMNLKRYNTTKMDILYNYYSLGEFRFMFLVGIVLYGLCHYNKEFLAWMILLLPIVYVLLQNTITQIYVVSAYQSSPQAVIEEKKEVVSTSSDRIMPEMSPPKPDTLSPQYRPDNPPMSTQTSELLGGASSGNDYHNIF